MRKWIKISVWTLLLAAGITVCLIRWQAWFGMPDEPRWTGDTISYSFRLPVTDNPSPVTDNPSPLTILILGDIHSQLRQADYDTLAARVPEADVVAQVGDWMERGQNYYRLLLLREWAPSQLSQLPVITCPGNHDYSKGLRKTLSPVWEETFLPVTGNPSPVTRLTTVPGATYYIDFPQLRFIALDTNPLDHLVHLTRTLTWLRQAINTADGRFVVVMMHHPIFSAAKGRFNLPIYAALRHALGDVDLVISGHDHLYQRSKNSFVVLNTSGRPKQPQTLLPVDNASDQPAYGVLKIDQSPISNLTFTVHRLSDGAVIDSLYVKHD